MAKVCDLTGKRPHVGNSVSHSNRKTKRRFLPNLQTKKVFIPELDGYVILKLSTSALRTMDKMGAYQFIKEQKAKGFDIGIY
jgi:large subunit ribosomal protein L28